MKKSKNVMILGVSLCIIGAILMILAFTPVFGEIVGAGTNDYAQWDKITFTVSTPLYSTLLPCQEAYLMLDFNSPSGKQFTYNSAPFYMNKADTISKDYDLFLDETNFHENGQYDLTAWYYCKTNDREVSTYRPFTKFTLKMPACTDNPLYCTTFRCSGEMYQPCKIQTNGCYAYGAMVVQKGKCGVTCISNSDCASNQYCSNTNYQCVNNIVSHSEQRCVGNDIYWFSSTGVKNDYVKTCLYNVETCENAVCKTIPVVCTPNTRTSCVGNIIYNFDSCGNLGTLVQTCTASETCTNGVCQGSGDVCTNKPATPCNGAVWLEFPTCTWDSNGCQIPCTVDSYQNCADGSKIIVQKCTGGVLTDTTNKCPTVQCTSNENCIDGFTCTEGQCVQIKISNKNTFLYLGIGIFVIGLIVIMLAMRKKR